MISNKSNNNNNISNIENFRNLIIPIYDYLSSYLTLQVDRINKSRCHNNFKN